MRLLVLFAVSFLLISVQTTIICKLPFLFSLYDMLLPFLIFLILFRRLAEVLPVIMVAGCAIDMISGAPIGVYMISYALLFLVFRNIKVYFQLKDTFIFQIVLIVGVLVELLLFAIVHSYHATEFIFSTHAVKIGIIQLIWAFLSGPIVFIVCRSILQILDQLFDFKMTATG